MVSQKNQVLDTWTLLQVSQDHENVMLLEVIPFTELWTPIFTKVSSQVRLGQIIVFSDNIIHKKSAEGLTQIGEPSAPDLYCIIVMTLYQWV
jgi:hypothetical protein